MEELLIFYNRWILLVEEIRVGAGAPANRLSINGTRASDGAYNTPQPGLTIDADGAEWTLRLDVSFDLQPFQWRGWLRAGGRRHAGALSERLHRSPQSH